MGVIENIGNGELKFLGVKIKIYDKEVRNLGNIELVCNQETWISADLAVIEEKERDRGREAHSGGRIKWKKQGMGP